MDLVFLPDVPNPEQGAGDLVEPPTQPRLGRKLAWGLAAAGAALFLLWWRLADWAFEGNARSIFWVALLAVGLAAAIVWAVGRSGRRRLKAVGLLVVGGLVMAIASLAVPFGLVPPAWCCLDLGQEPRPADWQSGAELVAFRGSKSHHADEAYGLAPVAGEAIAMPAHCVAYQEGRHHRLDKCAVVPGNVSLGGDGTVWGPWTLQVSWNGWGERLYEDVELHPERRTVVAFDDEGNPVAWWAGQRAANGWFSTE